MSLNTVVWITAQGLACPLSPGIDGGDLLVRIGPGAGGGPDGCEILARGTPTAVGAHPEARSAVRLDFRSHILMPGLVNAHAHLDLTSLGPQPRSPGQGFPEWLDGVRRSRKTVGEDVGGAVRAGIAASLRGGVVAIGDIAGRARPEPAAALGASPLMGVSYLELFGLGGQQTEAIAKIDGLRDAIRASARDRIRLGLSPHAPYSAGPDVYRHGAASGAPLCTHLAESIEERRVICDGDGPMRDFFAGLGLWDEQAQRHFGSHRSPIAFAMPWLSKAPWVLAHVNDCSDEDLRALATTKCSVAYCPRSSAYFEHDKSFGPHRYREMLSAGINVCLGTDSILNLPPGETGERLSVLDEMRLLFRRDRTDARTLLAMGTVNGARALGLDPSMFSLRPGRVAGLVAIPVCVGAQGCSTWNSDPFVRALESDDAPVLLWPVGALADCARETAASFGGARS